MGAADRNFSWQVIGRAVCGASHRRNGMPLQDAIRWVPADGSGPPLAVALADGHGSPVCLRSKAGADLAVEVATLLLHDFHRSHPFFEKSELLRSATEQIPKQLICRWREAVERQLQEAPFRPEELDDLERRAGASGRRALEADPLLAYGSTVLGVLAASSYLLFFQLGDGDFLIVSASGETKRPWPRDSRLLGVETTSLCMPQAWNEVRVGVQKVSKRSAGLLLLCTDGYSNSFREERGFLNVGRDFLEVIRSEGIEKVNESLDAWLAETTESGSGDDVSLGILYRSEPAAASAPAPAEAD